MIWPPWNNEACFTCSNNAEVGYIKDPCPCQYQGKCFIEQCNIAINEKRKFNYMNSSALETIKERFPDLTYNITYGTEEFSVKELNHWFGFRKNYTQQIYARY